METAIGVFSSRDRAEQAIKELLAAGVPKESIAFLTRSESDAKIVAKMGAFVAGFLGGVARITGGLAAAMLIVPGIGSVFAIGIGAAALVACAGGGARAGAAVGSVKHDAGATEADDG